MRYLETIKCVTKAKMITQVVATIVMKSALMADMILLYNIDIANILLYD